MVRCTLPLSGIRFGAALVTTAAAAAVLSAPAARADPTTLVPLLIKGHNADDSGTELAPNRFRIGRDGTLTVKLRWETDNGDAVSSRCHEVSKILDPLGKVVFERQQDLGGGCTGGGNWRARLSGLGTYKYILDVSDRDSSHSLHAELPFDIVLF